MRIDLMGLPVDALTLPETVERVARIVAEGHPRQQMSLNAAKVVQACVDEELRAGVAQQVLHLGRGARGVHAHHHGAECLRRHVRHEPLRTILGLNRNPVPTLEPAGAQPSRHSGDPLLVLGPRPLVPAAQVLLAQRHVARALPGVAQQAGGQRRRAAHAAAPPR